ncbi:MAG: hypothetical protein SOT28_07750 [Fusicatenibacter sp.]|nr:hypothetical protein [Lachnospiraceae bacterium]MDY2938184.1 hypothetical protein [Fusicatenibacter sp.]
MLNEKRVRQMTKLALYEQKEGKKAQKITRYFRSDYIGVALLKNFFSATFAYFLVLGFLVLYHIQWIMDEMDSINYVFLLGCIALSYLCFLTLYSAIVYGIASARYAAAQKSVKEYCQELDALQKIYDTEEKKRRRGRNRRADL